MDDLPISMLTAQAWVTMSNCHADKKANKFEMALDSHLRKFDPHENVASEERNDDADESSADEQDPVEPRCAGVVRPV